jgi:Ras-related protein Rab-18
MAEKAEYDHLLKVRLAAAWASCGPAPDTTTLSFVDLRVCLPDPVLSRRARARTHPPSSRPAQLLLVGDTAVGKSSLLLRFTDGTFDTDLQATIGVDFKVRCRTRSREVLRPQSPSLPPPPSPCALRPPQVKLMRVGGKVVKATIWDTAGQERFRTLTSTYYRGAHGIILVYDVTRPETFQHLTPWLSEIEMYSPGGGANVVKLLVGNKTDLASDRAVSTKEGEAWARSKGMLFLESSAKNADNVKAVFEEVVAKILETPALLANTAPSTARQGITRLDAPKPPTQNAPGGSGCC